MPLADVLEIRAQAKRIRDLEAALRKLIAAHKVSASLTNSGQLAAAHLAFVTQLEAALAPAKEATPDSSPTNQ